MGKMGVVVLLLLVFVLAASWTLAVDVRYYNQDGVTFKETRHVIQRPVITTHHEQRQQTVYRHELKTEMRDSHRTYRTPVTEYRCVTRWHGRWNPFVQPYLTQDLVPFTRWEHRTEAVQVPVVRTEWIPEQRTVQVPVTTRRMANEEVVSRVVVRQVPPSVFVAQRDGIGGVARLTSDPPRNTTGWQAARSAVRR